MKRAAWVIFGGVLTALVALVAAQFAEERYQQRAWTSHRGVQW